MSELTPTQKLRWLINHLESNQDYAIATESVRVSLDLIEAKHKEELKKAVIKAFNDGFKDNSEYENPRYRNGEHYFNSTRENHEIKV